MLIKFIQLVEGALSEGMSPVIVDNTNTQFWEMRPYVIAVSSLAHKLSTVDLLNVYFLQVTLLSLESLAFCSCTFVKYSSKITTCTEIKIQNRSTRMLLVVNSHEEPNMWHCTEIMSAIRWLLTNTNNKSTKYDLWVSETKFELQKPSVDIVAKTKIRRAKMD